jgi:dTDP-4-dehydrorhamnose reductase
MIGKTILITGVSGLLGSALKQHFRSAYILAPSRIELDVTNASHVQQYISKHQPHIIIHAAAHTNVEEAELNPMVSEQVNVAGTQNLLQACDEKVYFIYISSTGVYGDAQHQPWIEDDIASPKSKHHQHKLTAEKSVKTHINHLIIRTGWLFGENVSGKNFIINRLKEASGKSIIYADPFQYGCPTYVGDVAKQLELLIKNNITGMVNVVNESCMSRLTYIQQVFEYANLSVKVMPLNQPFNRLAPVSNNECAINNRLNQLGLNIMTPAKDVLKQVVQVLVSHI